MKYSLSIVIYLVVVTAMAACQAREKEAAAGEVVPPSLERKTPGAETVQLKTSDGWELTATYWRAGAGRPAAILLHMLPADRHSYDEWGPKLLKAGFNVLALDSRGHGDSLTHNGVKEYYRDFDENAYQESVEDIVAAHGFLEADGADVNRLVIVGASIGANLALTYAACYNSNVKAVALLSPGLDYHGVKTEAPMKKYGERPVYLVASADDGPSAEAVTRLKEIAPHAESQIFKNAGHGTNIFNAEPAFQGDLVTWLTGTVKW